MSGSVRPLAPSQVSRAASFRAGNALGAQRAALYPRQHRRHSCRHLVAAQQAQTEAGELCTTCCDMQQLHGLCAAWHRALVLRPQATQQGTEPCFHAVVELHMPDLVGVQTCIQAKAICKPFPMRRRQWAAEGGQRSFCCPGSPIACAACVCEVASKQTVSSAHFSVLPCVTALPQHPVGTHSQPSAQEHAPA